MADLAWDDRQGRYRDTRGRFVSDSTVRRVVDQVADAASERMAEASIRLLAGETSLGSWMLQMQQAIKLAHGAAAVLAHGGAAQMTPARWGAAGPIVKGEYQYLRAFGDDIASGRQPLNGSLTARARQYGQAGRVTFELTRGRDQQQRGYRFERNVLAPAEHCAVCVGETARGWVPIGSLIPIGRRTCRGNDRCHVRYSRTAEGEAAA